MADHARHLDDLQVRRELNRALLDERHRLGRELTSAEHAAVRARFPSAPPPAYRKLADADDLAAVIASAQASPALAEQLVAAETRQRADAQAAERRAAADRLQRLRARLRAAGVPEDHAALLIAGASNGKTSDGQAFNPKEDAIVRAKKWRGSPRRILALGGEVGRGKTLAACWLLAAGPRRPYPHPAGHDEADWPADLMPRFIRGPQLARLTMFKERGETSLELDLVERCSLLVIDEVDGDDVGPFARWAQRLESVVSGRYDARLDTVITTNMKLREFAVFGKKINDRVTGLGGTWEEFAGPSLRQGGGR